jgi:hypothetical protein
MMVAGFSGFSIKGGVIMTTNAAAASHLLVPTSANLKIIGKSGALRAALVGLCAVSLAGCETGSAVFGGDSTSPAQALAPVQAVPQAAATRLALAPVIGAPDGIAKQLTAQLTSSIERQRVTIAKSPSERVDYTLRGYVVAAKEKTATKVSYIWDVTDNTGKRVHRITGEEIVNGATGKDAWAGVNAAVVQAVSDKTSASFGTWLATVPAPAASAASPAIASVEPTAAAGTSGLVHQASATTSASSAPLGGTSKVMVASPKVTGAPGDGNAALSGAMKRELAVKGVEITDATAGTYRVLAEVKLKAKADGNEAVSIDWIVNDPKGTRIATVTQNNDIPKGHLSNAWGQNADDAAKGASIQIKQVIADHSAGKTIKSSGSANVQ